MRQKSITAIKKRYEHIARQNYDSQSVTTQLLELHAADTSGSVPTAPYLLQQETKVSFYTKLEELEVFGCKDRIIIKICLDARKSLVTPKFHYIRGRDDRHMFWIVRIQILCSCLSVCLVVSVTSQLDSSCFKEALSGHVKEPSASLQTAPASCAWWKLSFVETESRLCLPQAVPHQPSPHLSPQLPHTISPNSSW